MDWLPKQCSKHKWAPKTYGSNLSTIQNLIIPYIGSMEMQKLKPYHMENLYTTLSKTPCGSYIEGKKQKLAEKQKQRFLSGTTSLILKSTKTASSCRTIFMTSTLKEELKKWLNQLAADERKDPARCHDSGMLFRLPNGLAVEPVLIRKKFLKWQDAHPEFPRIVFHGLRHPYVKHTTKNKSLQKQKSQTIKQADSLGFALLLLLILKGAGCVELKKHFRFSISPYE